MVNIKLTNMPCCKKDGNDFYYYAKAKAVDGKNDPSHGKGYEVTWKSIPFTAKNYDRTYYDYEIQDTVNWNKYTVRIVGNNWYDVEAHLVANEFYYPRDYKALTSIPKYIQDLRTYDPESEYDSADILTQLERLSNIVDIHNMDSARSSMLLDYIEEDLIYVFDEIEEKVKNGNTHYIMLWNILIAIASKQYVEKK